MDTEDTVQGQENDTNATCAMCGHGKHDGATCSTDGCDCEAAE